MAATLRCWWFKHLRSHLTTPTATPSTSSSATPSAIPSATTVHVTLPITATRPSWVVHYWLLRCCRFTSSRSRLTAPASTTTAHCATLAILSTGSSLWVHYCQRHLLCCLLLCWLLYCWLLHCWSWTRYVSRVRCAELPDLVVQVVLPGNIQPGRCHRRRSVCWRELTRVL